VQKLAAQETLASTNKIKCRRIAFDTISKNNLTAATARVESSYLLSKPTFSVPSWCSERSRDVASKQPAAARGRSSPDSKPAIEVARGLNREKEPELQLNEISFWSNKITQVKPKWVKRRTTKINVECALRKCKTSQQFYQGFLRWFRDPIRVPRIREIGSLTFYSNVIPTFSLIIQSSVWFYYIFNHVTFASIFSTIYHKQHAAAARQESLTGK